MPQFSFVIPVVDEGAALGALLAQLAANFPDAERIVVDGGSSDDSVAVALGGADSVLMSPPGRALQMNLGAAAAAGQYLCFLHADTAPAFTQEMLKRGLAGEPLWAFCRVRLRSDLKALSMVGGAMNRRSALTAIATGDQLLIVSREHFRELGGFAAIPLMEDVEICKRLRARSRPRVLPLVVTTSARRWERDGVTLTVLRMWLLRLAYWLGVKPQRLWRHYYKGNAAALGSDPR